MRHIVFYHVAPSAQLPTPPDMGQSNDPPPVYQHQPLRLKTSLKGDAIRPINCQQSWMTAIQRHAFLVQHCQWYL